MNIVTALERISVGITDTQISPINQSSMLFSKLKQLYLQQQRLLKKQQTQTKTSVFALNIKPSNPLSTIPYQSTFIIPTTIQNKLSIPTDSIESLIKITDIIHASTTPQLMMRMEDCLIRKICQLKNPEQVIKMFTRVVYMKKYITRQSYSYIEDRMIKELLNISFKNCSSDVLVKFVYSLPFRTQSLLPLLSYFIEQSTDDNSIKCLYDLFSKLFPQKPSKQEIKYLLSISTKQATQLIHHMVKTEQINSQEMLQEEAKQKLKKVPSVFNSKGEAIMMYVLFVALYGGGIWQEIIQWQKTAIREYKDWFKSNAKNIVNDNHARDHLEVILLKLTNINYESQISELFFDHVIEHKSKDNVGSIIIKRFLSSKIFYKLETLKASNEKLINSKLMIVFDPSLIYVDILLDMFEDENRGKVFYSYLLESGEDNARILIGYLNQCYSNKKFKFIEFFIDFITVSRSELFQLSSNKLLHYFLQKIDIESAYVLSKELSLANPSRFYILFIKAWFFHKFQEQPERPALKASIIRNINILLIRGEIELNKQFLVDFKQSFYNDLSYEEKIKIMNDVSKPRKQTLGL